MMSSHQNGGMNTNINGKNNGVDDLNSDPSKIPANYGSIETNNVDLQMWMAHIPSKLASVWNDAPEGTVLGSLTFTKGGGKSQTQQRNPKTVSNSNRKVNNKHLMTVDIAPEFANQHPDLPPRYTIENISKKINGVLHPFTRHNSKSNDSKISDQNPSNMNSDANNKNLESGKNNLSASAITIHGSVTTSCHFQIAHDSQSGKSNLRQGQQYRNLCKKRLMETNSLKRVVKPVDSSELSLRRATATAVLTAGKGFGNAVQQHGKSLIEARENSINGKKRKIEIMEGQSVRSVIFELFSSRKFWSVRELKTASGLLEKEIKPVLSELCMFHKKGDHRNLWELRSEYQMQNNGADDDDGATSK